jgi:hypothetical protein
MEIEKKLTEKLIKSSFEVKSLSEIIRRLKIKKSNIPEVKTWLLKNGFEKISETRFYVNFK